MTLPTNIDGTSRAEQIAQLWKKRYCDIFNCVKSNSFVAGDVDNSEDVIVSPQEVYDIMTGLNNNKSCGANRISAEHSKNASGKLYPLLAICFTGFLIYGVLPNSLMSVILVLVIKDKAGKMNSKGNYRPIALASTLSKVSERAILRKIETFLTTSLDLNPNMEQKCVYLP